MRTTTQNENSVVKVVLKFCGGGWTLSFFDDKRDVPRWINAMREKYGSICLQTITPLKG